MAKLFFGKRDVYLEVAERYEKYIRLGVLKSGDKLPSVRVAAGELGVNPNTVQKAYSYLEDAGLIRSLPKKGAFVIYTTTGDVNVERSEAIELISGMRDNGVTKEELLKIIEEVYE